MIRKQTVGNKSDVPQNIEYFLLPYVAQTKSHIITGKQSDRENLYVFLDEF